MNQTAKLAELKDRMCLNEQINLNMLKDKLQNTLHHMEISLCMTGTISAVLKDRVNIITGSIGTKVEFIHSSKALRDARVDDGDGDTIM